MDVPFRYIVVEGPIGVGKTTLARRLAESFSSELILEAPEANPFLPRFYENPRRYALSTQLYFLLERARRVDELQQADLFRPVRVADFLMDKDRLFAGVTLDADELRLYDELSRQLIADPPRPDLVIYLQAPVKVLRERIARRGVAYEENLDGRYLQSVAEAYTRFFHHYDASALLIVNAAEIDLARGEEDYATLLEQVRAGPRGRQYFNPLPF